MDIHMANDISADVILSNFISGLLSEALLIVQLLAVSYLAALVADFVYTLI
jgi:hypothetical protein